MSAGGRRMLHLAARETLVVPASRTGQNHLMQTRVQEDT